MAEFRPLQSIAWLTLNDSCAAMWVGQPFISAASVGLLCSASHLLQDVQRRAALHMPAGPGVPQVVPPEVSDARALQRRIPSLRADLRDPAAQVAKHVRGVFEGCAAHGQALSTPSAQGSAGSSPAVPTSHRTFRGADRVGSSKWPPRTSVSAYLPLPAHLTAPGTPGLRFESRAGTTLGS